MIVWFLVCLFSVLSIATFKSTTNFDTIILFLLPEIHVQNCFNTDVIRSFILLTHMHYFELSIEVGVCVWCGVCIVHAHRCADARAPCTCLERPEKSAGWPSLHSLKCFLETKSHIELRAVVFNQTGWPVCPSDSPVSTPHAQLFTQVRRIKPSQSHGQHCSPLSLLLSPESWYFYYSYLMPIQVSVYTGK